MAFADSSYFEPEVGVTCDQDARAIRLNYLWPDMPGPELPDAQEWIRTADLITVKRDGDNVTRTPRSPAIRTCTLGGVKYAIYVRPHLCRYGMSADVSIKQGVEDILRPTAFDAGCSSSDLIAEMTFFAEDPRIIICTVRRFQSELQPNCTVVPDARKRGARGTP